MLKKLLASALIAGFAAGLIAALLQYAFVQPLLVMSELYESGEAVHFGAGAMAHAVPDADFDIRRVLFNVLFNVFTYAGYGLVLVAAMALAAERGVKFSARTGVLFGLAGYAAVQFAPAFGLAPELPGNAAADVGPRQIWWFATAILTAGGLWLIAFGSTNATRLAGVGALLIPHIIGAPHPTTFTGPAPPELAALYATRALGTGLVVWVILGIVAAYIWEKDAP